MKPRIEADELMQRILREARRHEELAFPSADSTDANDLRRLVPPVLSKVETKGFSCDSLLAQVGNMLESARVKTTVGKGVPKLLRQFWRNQGGYNDIVLETLARLRDASRQLMTENVQLRLHIQRQTEWMQVAERRLALLETPPEGTAPRGGPPGAPQEP